MSMHPIRQFRKSHGLTQGQLAERIGVNLVTISRWETGARMPGGHDLERISTETGIPMEEIVRAGRTPQSQPGAAE